METQDLSQFIGKKVVITLQNVRKKLCGILLCIESNKNIAKSLVLEDAEGNRTILRTHSVVSVALSEESKHKISLCTNNHEIWLEISGVDE